MVRTARSGPWVCRSLMRPSPSLALQLPAFISSGQVRATGAAKAARGGPEMPDLDSRRLFESRVRALSAARRGSRLRCVLPAPVQGPFPPPAGSLHGDVTDHGHELAFPVSGVMRVIVPPGRTFELIPGDLLLIGRGIEHHEAPASPDSAYATCWCYVGGTHARIDHTAYRPGAGWTKGPGIALIGRTDVESIARAVASEMENRESGWAVAVRNLLCYLSLILVRRLRRGSVVRYPERESPALSTNARGWRAVQEAVRFCEDNFQRPVRLEEVSRVVGYSPRHLSRLVTSHLGHSLHEHWRGIRIEAAQQLLGASELPVSEIAHTLGYTDPANFTHAFIRATGLSPTTYRRRHGRR